MRVDGRSFSWFIVLVLFLSLGAGVVTACGKKAAPRPPEKAGVR